MIDLDDIRQYLQAVKADDEAGRRTSLNALRQYSDKDWASVPDDKLQPLIEAMQDQLIHGSKQAIIRQGIVITLANIGPRAAPAAPTLALLLGPEIPDRIREDVVAALAKIGPGARAAIDPLVKMLGSSRLPMAGRVILALSAMGQANPAVRKSLTALWLAGDPSQSSQVQLAYALCKLQIRAEGVIDLMTRTAATHPEAAIRKLAIEALSFCEPDGLDVVPSLLAAALHDRDEKVRGLADASLKSLNVTHEQAVLECARQLKNARFAEVALRSSGPLAVSALVEAIETRDAPTTEIAIRILASLGEAAAAAAPTVAGALRDKNRGIRLAAAKCVWNITKDANAAVPALVALLEQKWSAAEGSDEDRRRFVQTVIEALCRIGHAAQAAVPALKAKTKDPNRNISESATIALKAIAPDAAAKS